MQLHRVCWMRARHHEPEEHATSDFGAVVQAVLLPCNINLAGKIRPQDNKDVVLLPTVPRLLRIWRTD